MPTQKNSRAFIIYTDSTKRYSVLTKILCKKNLVFQTLEEYLFIRFVLQMTDAIVKKTKKSTQLGYKTRKIKSYSHAKDIV